MLFLRQGICITLVFSYQNNGHFKSSIIQSWTAKVHDHHSFKDVSTWWKITEADLLDNKVKLRFAEGILPGWDIEERNVCTKEVHFNEVSCTKVKFVFEQIGGKEENVIKEETKSWNETLKDIKEYGAL